jgi:hypothetical protein
MRLDRPAAALALLCAYSICVSAQQPDSAIFDSAQCPVVSGLGLRLTTGDSGAPRTRATPVLSGDRDLIDTTWRFDIVERRWNQPYLNALVGAGLAAGRTASGTTGAADSARSWSACAGAWIELHRVNLMLRGARGVVHLRTDLRSLRRAGMGSDTTTQPER